MKRVLAILFALTMVLIAVGLSSGNKTAPGSVSLVANNAIRTEIEEANPWTRLELNDSPDDFHFAVISDRTGGERRGIFPKAVAQLNLLQPKFVVSVGDLIQGYTNSATELNSQWEELQREVHKLHMPFFFVAGNHDISNPVQDLHWRKRFGRRHYSFTYRNVLFLMLNSDDPPQNGGGLGKEQIAWAHKALSANPDARWTFVVLHRPLWEDKNGTANGWADVEQLLDGRPYTVFVGHEHRYQRFVRQGMNYYQLATTGGGSTMRGAKHGEIDHFAWVTMRKNVPLVANVLLDGVLSDNFAASASP